MPLTVGLRGYPEAVLAADAITLDLPGTSTASAIIQGLAAKSARLRHALLREDGTPRQSSKVLVDGTPIAHASVLPSSGTVTVLAALPCDG
jgi:hypothetical protein